MEKGPRTQRTGRQEKMRAGRMIEQMLVDNEYFVMSCDGARSQPAGLQGAARLQAPSEPGGSGKRRDTP